ncbi:alpha/beta hydrolase [Chitinimonas sp. BJYL2]|uniref:alpha/beta hydrolase n=1 Tax=Chitinimonas sp. BJYL2 TaxID=2976696 RepID=UPI0022B4DAF4|nr:alpha/beta hydrolase [Chitinimonas sp. BJYL2]
MKHGIQLAIWLLLAAAQGCANAQPFSLVRIDTVNGEMALLQRGATVAPLRYRAIVLPGSGCAGLAPIAERYFAGLLHGEVWVLHKPGVDAAQWPAPDPCSPDFIASDAPLNNLAAYESAIRQQVPAASDLPLVLIGISEGAELVPALSQRLGGAALWVMLGNAAQDPAEVGERQAVRLGQTAAWQRLRTAAASQRPDSQIIEGRTLAYWRQLFAMRLTDTVQASTIPLLLAYGEQDALIPADVYANTRARLPQRPTPSCVLAQPDADHGLQTPVSDGVQQVWARVEQHFRGGWACPAP